ncbi:hypothetical protein [Nocardia sp. NPDC058497]|uniref:hypothetical protein n=1 Tax=Nocardia sp. NPDC058497 TaxID=3346529 RepID=UPI0036583468
MGELNVDPAVLEQAKNGINGIIGELTSLGVMETGAVGRGFSLLALSPLEAGKAVVQSSFETFTERWSWGVRALVQSGNALAETLGLAAGRYSMMEEQFSNTFKEMFTHLAGNPHLTDADIDKRSWADTLSDNQANWLSNPQYSGDSFTQAFGKIGDNASLLGQLGSHVASNPEMPEQSLLQRTFLPDTGMAAKAAEIQAAQAAARGGK